MSLAEQQDPEVYEEAMVSPQRKVDTSDAEGTRFTCENEDMETNQVSNR